MHSASESKFSPDALSSSRKRPAMMTGGTSSSSSELTMNPEVSAESKSSSASRHSVRQRKRRKVANWSTEGSDRMTVLESKQLSKALRESQRLALAQEELKKLKFIPEAPTFRPSWEEFQDPYKYIASIRTQGIAAGIIKVIPPAGWKMPVMSRPADTTIPMPTKLQRLHHLAEGKSYDDGNQYTLPEYIRMADQFKRKWWV